VATAENAIIEPTTVEEAARALRTIGEPRSPADVTIVGNATKLADLKPAVECVSTRRLNRVIEYAPEDMTITVEAGVSFDAINALTAKDNLRLALDPPGYDGQATIGGVLATNDSGPMRAAYGSPRDMVLGATIVLYDGTVIRSGGRVVKNVAGYGLHRLMCGSWGRFGLIASATLRLRPRAESLRLATWPARLTMEARLRDDLTGNWVCNVAAQFTRSIRSGPHQPALLTWMCDKVGVDEDITVIVGFEDDAQTAEDEVVMLSRKWENCVAHSPSDSVDLYRRILTLTAGAPFRAGVRPSRVPHAVAELRCGSRVIAHALSGAIVLPDHPDTWDATANTVRSNGGHLIVPRRLAADEHDGLRARVASALRGGTPA